MGGRKEKIMKTTIILKFWYKHPQKDVNRTQEWGNTEILTVGQIVTISAPANNGWIAAIVRNN